MVRGRMYFPLNYVDGPCSTSEPVPAKHYTRSAASSWGATSSFPFGASTSESVFSSAFFGRMSMFLIKNASPSEMIPIGTPGEAAGQRGAGRWTGGAYR